MATPRLDTPRLDSLRIGYRYRQRLTPGGTQDWSFDVTVDGADSADGADGDVTVDGADGAGVELPVGSGTAILLDLYAADPHGSLDGYDPHVHRIRDAVLDPSTRELEKSWGHDLEMYGDRLLVLRSWVPTRPGLSVLVSAMVLAELGRHTVAAVYAPRRPGEPGLDSLPDVDEMERGGLDFRPVGDGVYYLDPAGVDVTDVLRRVSAG